ncbi:hypothetical protein [Bradyrhizobium sp. SZCCHNS2002]|uniref:hypothetical protein n=1 Tax=Bradyrhizobium sp. SZCCHNS2002 TaxID=3057302 RepID=UPI00291694F6|nr:hypothetical protein [Bradyrhizobium sp. SZCCHNS2002]
MDWTSIAQYSGIAGIVVGLFVYLSRGFIREWLFPKLTRQQAFTIILVIVIGCWSLSGWAIYWGYNARSTLGEVLSPDNDFKMVFLKTPIDSVYGKSHLLLLSSIRDVNRVKLEGNYFVRGTLPDCRDPGQREIYAAELTLRAHEIEELTPYLHENFNQPFDSQYKILSVLLNDTFYDAAVPWMKKEIEPYNKISKTGAPVFCNQDFVSTAYLHFKYTNFFGAPTELYAKAEFKRDTDGHPVCLFAEIDKDVFDQYPGEVPGAIEYFRPDGSDRYFTLLPEAKEGYMPMIMAEVRKMSEAANR